MRGNIEREIVFRLDRFCGEPYSFELRGKDDWTASVTFAGTILPFAQSSIDRFAIAEAVLSGALHESAKVEAIAQRIADDLEELGYLVVRLVKPSEFSYSGRFDARIEKGRVIWDSSALDWASLENESGTLLRAIASAVALRNFPGSISQIFDSISFLCGNERVFFLRDSFGTPTISMTWSPNEIEDVRKLCECFVEVSPPGLEMFVSSFGRDDGALRSFINLWAALESLLSEFGVSSGLVGEGAKACQLIDLVVPALAPPEEEEVHRNALHQIRRRRNALVHGGAPGTLPTTELRQFLGHYLHRLAT